MRLIVLVLASVYTALALAPTGPTRPALKRELLISTPTVKNPSFQEQMGSIHRSRKDLLERDVEVVLVFGSASEADRKPYGSDDLFLLLNSRDEAEQRHDLHIRYNQFTVILIGKDGGEKLRQHMPISVDKLNATIDAMPMRQDEMRQQR